MTQEHEERKSLVCLRRSTFLVDQCHSYLVSHSSYRGVGLPLFTRLPSCRKRLSGRDDRLVNPCRISSFYDSFYFSHLLAERFASAWARVACPGAMLVRGRCVFGGRCLFGGWCLSGDGACPGTVLVRGRCWQHPWIFRSHSHSRFLWRSFDGIPARACYRGILPRILARCVDVPIVRCFQSFLKVFCVNGLCSLLDVEWWVLARCLLCLVSHVFWQFGPSPRAVFVTDRQNHY